MIDGFIVLLACLFAGNIISDFFVLPVPGSIIGMLILFCGLLVRKGVSPSVDKVSMGLISVMGMLFVPAGVGISQYFDLLAREWPLVFFAGMSTTLLSLAVTAFLFQTISKRKGGDK
ncbi:MAG: CidA/LrgA family protein [Alphaproteobacteria bacterium]